MRVRQTVSDDEQDGDSRGDLEDIDNELYCGEYRLPEFRIEIKDDKAWQIPIISSIGRFQERAVRDVARQTASSCRGFRSRR